MCTVSFLPLGDHKFMITSNRDDAPSRATSNIVTEIISGKKVVFPKDPKASGTWIAMSDNDQMAVLLNGAFEKHKWQPPYKESRGTMFLSFFNYSNVPEFIKSYDFKGMEPFTFIVYEKESLNEIIWDEAKIHHKVLDITEKKIWASCTLYDKEVQKKRTEVFNDRFTELDDVKREDIVCFHKGSGKTDLENGFLINRNNKVQTLSITNITRTKGEMIMNHNDLILDELKSVSISNNY